jgi:hypothetical protein
MGWDGLKSIISTVVNWAGKRLMRDEEVIRLLRKVGYEQLENNFESIYVHGIVILRAEGKDQVCAILRHDEVISAFHEYWKTLKFEPLVACFRSRVDALRRAGYIITEFDADAELKAFAALFRDLARRAGTASEQEQTALLSELRETLHGPPLAEALHSILSKLYEQCQLERVLVTRFHLFETLMAANLSSLHARLRNCVGEAMGEIRPRLHDHEFYKSGFGVTDAVKKSIARARTRAREMSLSEIGIEGLLYALLEDPGDQLKDLLMRHGTSPDELRASLGTHTPQFLIANRGMLSS